MSRFPALLCLFPLAFLPCAVRAATATVYQCTSPQGQVSYQDKPCGKTQRQQTLALPDVPTVHAPNVTEPARDTGTSGTDSASQTQLDEPTTPPSALMPDMYTCTRATDGKTYQSSNGQPAPYLAPYGMLGTAQLSLSEAYRPTQGAGGISAPEANRGKVTSDLVGNNYVWVQDQCRLLSPQENCRALHDAYDENARKLQHAFKSDRPPLEKRDAELRAQLDHC